MTAGSNSQSTSTELTGGAGFNYEDLVVAYYLAALLLEGHAAGGTGVVRSVAVQQAADHPMDDLVVELEDEIGHRVLALQIKRSLRLTAATSNSDFLNTMAAAVATRRLPAFQEGRDAYGFVVEHVAMQSYRSINRLIDWARAEVCGKEFARRFEAGGSAAAAEREMRKDLRSLTEAQTDEEEVAFYQHLVALRIDGLGEGGLNRGSVVTQLQGLIANDQGGLAELLFDRLCRLASDGAGLARKWTRATLVQQIRGAAPLRCAPSYFADLDLVQRFSSEGMADILETIGGCHVERPSVCDEIDAHLEKFRLVNLAGLPGCGKSVALKQFAKRASAKGPLLFLKSDRLLGNSWSAFSAMLGLRHTAEEILAEIGSAGTPILFIDGIDRVRPDQKGVITDLLRVIETHDSLSDWKVLATSRDQGMEPYRAWFPSSFYQEDGIGDVLVKAFSDGEANQLADQLPALCSLLSSSSVVKEIARRPFFAAVLARDSTTTQGSAPQTEIDLITAWWSRAGYDASPDSADVRRRAIIDLAEKGVGELGKSIRLRRLEPSTIAQLASLKVDLIVRDQDDGAAVSFTHDIFFEWAFYRLLVDLGPDWHDAIAASGEPPLLGRVVGLLAQQSLSSPGRWTKGYRLLESKPLRPQWRRVWLTAPPFTAALMAPGAQAEFTSVMQEANFQLLEKLLVWFQAEHAIPNPVILGRAGSAEDGEDSIRIAHLLGWPSDVRSWGRLIDWLLSVAATLPGRLILHAAEVFEVWLNMWANHHNKRTAGIVAQSSQWLLQLENSGRADLDNGKWNDLGREATGQLAATLRRAILRSAPTFPDAAIELYKRAAETEHSRDDVYGNLMAYAHIMATVAPEAIVTLAKSELLEELPGDRFAREEEENQKRMERRKAIRAIPEADRTHKQQQLLDHAFYSLGQQLPGLDDIGIRKYHVFYTDTSALHEPFASLFAHAPDSALELIRDMANHAVKGWRQVHALRGDMKTPLPVIVEFPWGKQTFWGDWLVYSWSQGQLTAAPLECAFLAMSYWAYRQLEQGRATDDLIRVLVQDSECIATLGLALVIALETLHVSETTLALVGCQRLWQHDIKRLVQTPTLDIDIFGLGLHSRLTGDKAKAQDFLKTRQSRTRNVRQLAVAFAITGDDQLRARFRAALAAFPTELPFEFEEDTNDIHATKRLKELAVQWAGQGDSDNYRAVPTQSGFTEISYESPVPLDSEQQTRLEETTAFLRASSVLDWATHSLEQNALQPRLNLESAIVFAKEHDADDMFDVRYDVGDHAVQSAISCIAACVIRFGPEEGGDFGWAWEVMRRVWNMQERPLNGSQVSWHPFNHLIVALVHQRQTDNPDTDAVTALVDLTAHPLEGVSALAFAGLLRDADLVVTWVAAQLAMRMAIRWRSRWTPEGGHDHSQDHVSREQSLQLAQEALCEVQLTQFPTMPKAWDKLPGSVEEGSDQVLRDPDPSFDWRFAASIFKFFPVERWCASDKYGPLWQSALAGLAGWTASRLIPPEPPGREQHHPEEYEWHNSLGHLCARSAPLVDEQWFIDVCLRPYLVPERNALQMLSRIAQSVTIRHVVDAACIPPSTLPLLELCAERLINDRAFSKRNDGSVHDNALSRLITALLFVEIEDAPGASRFANGDWSQIAVIMPLVSSIMTSIGWSSYVMGKFLTLCERAADAYPLDAFIKQVSTALKSLELAQGSWAGTALPARIAGVVQRLADKHFPLDQDQSLGLLSILDTLIDLGDRRSSALEQSEAFRDVRKSC
ncbi:AAA family ATPase [Pseudomonas sp. JDS08PS003]|uniref:AAA family ATPase n=1 Tax=Pseudomonas sp. JDS08PS003 TaxID=2497162 RepID=UPI003857F0B9